MWNSLIYFLLQELTTGGMTHGVTQNETGNAGTRDNSDVLDKYRFFVPTSHYEDADGAVRRIFGW